MGIKRFIALAAMIANAMSHDNIFVGGKQRSGMAFNPDYRPVGDRKELRSVLGENVNKSISRNMKIKATKYRNDYRVWLDYAGDYRNENIE